MLIKMFASGTNVQRLAKSSSKVDGVLYTAYSELEQTETDIVKRKFYAADLTQLKNVVESEDVNVQPSWTKIWGKPNSNKAFISKLFNSFVGNESEIAGLNLDQMTGETNSVFMVLTSAYNDQMTQVAKIIRKNVEGYDVVVLNGDYTSNRKAEDETVKAINIAKNDGKKGVIILANQMGSRSYSIPQIQTTIMAYDRGSVDASQQKVSRCLTPGETFENETKSYGHIVDLSFDPNRSENIELLLVDEIIQVQRSQNLDFPTATSFVLNAIDLGKVNKFGYVVPVTEEQMFNTLNEQENLLKVADVTVDVAAICQEGLLEDLINVVEIQNPSVKKLIVGEEVVNKLTIDPQQKDSKAKKDPSIKQVEDIINSAVKTINMSATSVYFMADSDAKTYRESLNTISKPEQFVELIGVEPKVVIQLLDKKVLNEAVLDVVVQNSKKVQSVW